MKLVIKRQLLEDFPVGTVGNSLPANAGATVSIPGAGGFHVPGAIKAVCHDY